MAQLGQLKLSFWRSSAYKLLVPRLDKKALSKAMLEPDAIADEAYQNELIFRLLPYAPNELLDGALDALRNGQDYKLVERVIRGLAAGNKLEII